MRPLITVAHLALGTSAFAFLLSAPKVKVVSDFWVKDSVGYILSAQKHGSDVS